ncbi:hypothetical protein [Longirhabdus pacifica]|uniref:hypothetical protein n=1 Tax=Longirhabdus pacifica TaxID=2305227 RepID=UPI0010089068|nr:hypothetical protein [Longirhabdus pacifica]
MILLRKVIVRKSLGYGLMEDIEEPQQINTTKMKRKKRQTTNKNGSSKNIIDKNSKAKRKKITPNSEKKSKKEKVASQDNIIATMNEKLHEKEGEEIVSNMSPLEVETLQQNGDDQYESETETKLKEEEGKEEKKEDENLKVELEEKMTKEEDPVIDKVIENENQQDETNIDSIAETVSEKTEVNSEEAVYKWLVEDDGNCKVGNNCLPNEHGIATPSKKGYRVIARMGKNQILVLFNNTHKNQVKENENKAKNDKEERAVYSDKVLIQLEMMNAKLSQALEKTI